jgi:hypothetical protein
MHRLSLNPSDPHRCHRSHAARFLAEALGASVEHLDEPKQVQKPHPEPFRPFEQLRMF